MESDYHRMERMVEEEAHPAEGVHPQGHTGLLATDRVAISVRGESQRLEGPLQGVHQEAVLVREDHSPRRGPNLSGSRVLSKRGRPGEPVQRDEGLLDPRPRSGILPRQCVHLRTLAYKCTHYFITLIIYRNILWFLVIFQSIPEEEAFAIFVQIMQHYNLREIYKPNMYHLGLCMYQLDCMLQENIPELHQHFAAHGFQTSMYCSSWFLTLFTTALPLSLVCRIFDIFLNEGFEIVFRIGMAILECHKDSLMVLDMEGMIKVFFVFNDFFSKI